MSTEIAKLHATIGADVSGFQQGLGGVQGALVGVGSAVTEFGINAISSFVQNGVGSVMEFDKSMRNIQAVTGDTDAGVAALSKQLLDIGGASVAGPQAVADAYYDIAGGVADASVRTATLNAAIATSEAGNASLASTTKGLISTMNAYGFSAEQAGMVSDVFTQTVGKGVGSMDEFVAAMGPLAGLAATSGVDFDHLGSMMAFMTTKGTSAAQSATQIKAAMVAVLNPNKDMQKALKAMGVESGSAALEMYGLEGTLGRLNTAMGGSTDAMAAAMGSTEALQAAVAINDKGYEEFLGTFQDTMGGVTQAAREVQLQGLSNQLDIMKNQFSSIGIEVGTALVPAFNTILGGINSFISDVKAKGLGPALIEWFNKGVNWLRDNASGIFEGALKGAVALGASISQWLSTNGPAIGAGIQTWFKDAITWLRDTANVLWQGALSAAINFAGDFASWLSTNGPAIGTSVQTWFNAGLDWLKNEGSKKFGELLGGAFQLGKDVTAFVAEHAPDIGAGIGTWVRGALTWLTTEAPKLVSGAIAGLFSAKPDLSGLQGGDMAADLIPPPTVFEQLAQSGVDAMLNIFKGGVGLIAGVFAGLFGLDDKGELKKSIDKFFAEDGPLKKALTDAGKFITDKFLPSIAGIGTAIQNVFKGVFDIVTRPFKDALVWLGKQLVALAEKLPVLQNEVRGVGQGLVDFGGGSMSDNAAPIGPTQSGAPLPGRAGGGSVGANMPYIVGENGPELFVPNASGMIYPNGSMPVSGGSFGGGGNSGTVYVTQNVAGMTDGRELVEMVISELRRRNMTVLEAG